MIPLVTISSEIFHALSNSLRLLLFQFGTTSTEEPTANKGPLCSSRNREHSLFCRLVLKDMDMFLRFTKGTAGLPKSITGKTLRFLCIRNLLSGCDDRRFLPARPSKRTIGGRGRGRGRATMREEAPRRGVRGRVARRVGVCAVGGRVVYRTTRTEETGSLGRRGGWERFWLSGVLTIPSVPEERHVESRY